MQKRGGPDDAVVSQASPSAHLSRPACRVAPCEPSIQCVITRPPIVIVHGRGCFSPVNAVSLRIDFAVHHIFRPTRVSFMPKLCRLRGVASKRTRHTPEACIRAERTPGVDVHPAVMALFGAGVSIGRNSRDRPMTRTRGPPKYRSLAGFCGSRAAAAQVLGRGRPALFRLAAGGCGQHKHDRKPQGRPEPSCTLRAAFRHVSWIALATAINVPARPDRAAADLSLTALPAKKRAPAGALASIRWQA